MHKLMIAALMAAAGTPALAQNVDLSGGLVDVTIQDVQLLNNFLNDTQIAALNDIAVPINVQVPVGIAANVCGIDANVLAKQKKTGDAACDATSGSEALAKQVVKQHLRQTR